MTYIEFFSKDAIENLCAYFAMPPERIVFVGDKMKLMQKQMKSYGKVLSARGHEVELVCKYVDKDNLSDIVSVLEELVTNYTDCVFGLTGGEELYLVAMGVVFERHRDKTLSMHKFNIKNNVVIDCDQDGHTIFEGAFPRLTVEENILIHGGNILDSERSIAAHKWSMEEDFQKDINKMWEICCENPKRWNSQMSLLAAAEEIKGLKSEELQVCVSIAYVEEHVKNSGTKCTFSPGIFKELYKAGVLDTYFYADGELFLIYKNEQIKRCMTKAGQLLELKIYLEALLAKDKDGESVYHDVRTGVNISWSGELKDDCDDNGTCNEIDVMMTRGMVPVFISCKNGRVEMEELYKLNTVAERFGGEYAKKVLICNNLGTSELQNDYFRLRAKDMGILLIENISIMSDGEIRKKVRNLWCN